MKTTATIAWPVYHKLLRRISLVFLLLMAPLAGWTQILPYTWTGGGLTNNWSEPLNWAPTRVLPLATDILVFDPLALTPTPFIVSVNLDFATETAAQLRFLNGVTVILTSTAPANLTLNGNLAGPEFELTGTTVGGTPTSVQLAGSNAITVSVAAGQQGRVSGNLSLVGGPHRLTAGTFESLEFVAGSLCTASNNFTGNAFGAMGITNSVIFRTGATYAQQAGASPFGNTASSVARFDKGSRFIARTSNLAVSNRTYGTLEVDPMVAMGAAGTINSSGSGNLTILDDLIITGGTVTLGPNSIQLAGSLTANGGQLNLTGANIRFNGTTPQLINGNGANPISVSNATEIQLANSNGLTISHPVESGGNLNFGAGKITTIFINGVNSKSTLQVSKNTTYTGNGPSNFVDGPLSCLISPGAANVAFPIGKDNAYRPVSLEISAQTNTVVYTANQINASPPARTLNGGIQRVSRVRYFSVVPDVAPAGFMGKLTLSFGQDDQVTDARAPTFVIGKSDGNSWENIGRSGSTVASIGAGFETGTLTSLAFTSFSDFVLASTEVDPNVNPLPVTLSGFTAEQTPVGVALRWTTATEKNNARFEVQRSADGHQFGTIATVSGQGQSSRLQRYTTLDERPLPSLSYYRLRQVDFDGTATFSPVVTVAAGKELALYPNPAAGKVTIKWPQQQAAAPLVRVTDLAGRVIQTFVLPASGEFDVSELKAGTYLVTLGSGGQQATRRLVKE